MKQTDRYTQGIINIDEISHSIRSFGFDRPVDAAVILGSGLGGFTEQISQAISLSYHQVPNFPVTSVTGHKGELMLGEVAGKSVLAFSGRFHRYEGFSLDQTVLPVRIAQKLGARLLVISNAAGGINRSLEVGDLMIIDDIMRLIGTTTPTGFPPYRCRLKASAAKVRELAADSGLTIRTGTYLFVQGPNYETKAEIRAFRTLGADAVGMSTVPEIAEASRLGIDTAAISLITNMASGITEQKLDHKDVEITAKRRKKDFIRLVSSVIEKW